MTFKIIIIKINNFILPDNIWFVDGVKHIYIVSIKFIKV